MGEVFPLIDEPDEDIGWQDRSLFAQTDPVAFFPE